MHYMKYEAFNWIFHSSFMCLDIQMLWVHYTMENSAYGVAESQFVVGLFVMVVSHFLILIVYSYQLANEHRNDDKFQILPKHFNWLQYVLLGLASVGYVVTSYLVYSYPKTEKYILVHWIMVEAASFPFIIFYMFV